MNREAVLKLIVPGLLVVFVYWVAAPRLLGKWGESINPRTAAARARSALDADRGRAPTREQLFAEAAAVAELTGTVDAQRARKAELERKWGEMTAVRAVGVKRAELLSRIEGVLTANNLTPVEQSAAAADAGAQVPASLRPALDQLKPPGGEAGRMYKFRFRGRYSEVSAALDELVGRDWPAFPVGLTMEEADFDQPIRAWTLLIWM